MISSDKIFIAGHTGMVGSAIVRKLTEKGYDNLILRTSREMDLRNQNQVLSFFEKEKPAYVFLAAAKVGGILANNTYRAEFLYDNLMIEANIIHSSYLTGVKKLLFLGSSCIYPRMAPQPIKEDSLLTGLLEPTNEPYAIAKIAGIKLCDAYRAQYGCNYISAMPTNLYGPNDNYDLNSSHVLPSLIRKIHTAQKNNLEEVILWGTGKPLREFMHVDDLAEACLFLMNVFNRDGFINVGTGKEISILELAFLIKDIVGFKGNIAYDDSKPDGTPRKLMDVSKLAELGWTSTISLNEGIRNVYKMTSSLDWY
ncbi:MAG: GDP-L-fucose synthase [Saprospiraceae bacterium]